MIQITEYLLSKEKPSCTDSGFEAFPKKPKLSAVVKFLEDMGFKKSSDSMVFDDAIRFNTPLDKPTYTVDESGFGRTEVKFCMAGSVVEDNPVVWVCCTDSGHVAKNYVAGGYKWKGGNTELFNHYKYLIEFITTTYKHKR